MNRVFDKVKNGFTLLEMLLVMVVIASIMVAVGTYMQQQAENLRISRTVTQMQTILSAGIAYYMANNSWPTNKTAATWNITNNGTDPLATSGYLPAITTGMPNPWGLQGSGLSGGPTSDQYYYYYWTTATSTAIPPNSFQVLVYVGTTARQQELAQIMAGMLPMAYVPTATDAFDGLTAGNLRGYVIAYINAPGQSVTSSTSIQFAGIYHHGACVPAPACPMTSSGTAMSPEVFVVPVSVSGANDTNNPGNIYPISSFSAYATGNSPLDTSPPLCTNQTTVTPSSTCSGGGVNNQYWRACLQVITQNGDLAVTRTDTWGNSVTVSAFTRCSPANEAVGSSFSVYGN